jgi:hypothetical protein
MAQDIQKKKRLVAIVYATVFLGLFSLATAVSWNRRVEDAKSAKDAAPPSTASQVAPVKTR